MARTKKYRRNRKQRQSRRRILKGGERLPVTNPVVDQDYWDEQGNYLGKYIKADGTGNKYFKRDIVYTYSDGGLYLQPKKTSRFSDELYPVQAAASGAYAEFVTQNLGVEVGKETTIPTNDLIKGNTYFKRTGSGSTSDAYTITYMGKFLGSCKTKDEIVKLFNEEKAGKNMVLINDYKNLSYWLVFTKTQSNFNIIKDTKIYDKPLETVTATTIAEMPNSDSQSVASSAVTTATNTPVASPESSLPGTPTLSPSSSSSSLSSSDSLKQSTLNLSPELSRTSSTDSMDSVSSMQFEIPKTTEIDRTQMCEGGIFKVNVKDIKNKNNVSTVFNKMAKDNENPILKQNSKWFDCTNKPKLTYSLEQYVLSTSKEDFQTKNENIQSGSYIGLPTNTIINALFDENGNKRYTTNTTGGTKRKTKKQRRHRRR